MHILSWTAYLKNTSWNVGVARKDIFFLLRRNKGIQWCRVRCYATPRVIGASPNTVIEAGNAGGCLGCCWMTIMPVRLRKTMWECVAYIMRKKQHPSITTVDVLVGIGWRSCLCVLAKPCESVWLTSCARNNTWVSLLASLNSIGPFYRRRELSDKVCTSMRGGVAVVWAQL